MCSSILPCSSIPIHIDARTLCQTAGSLKTLKLKVRESCTSEALADVFDHKPLEELNLTLISAAEVSIVHVHLIQLCGVDTEGPFYMNPLCGFLLCIYAGSTQVLVQQISAILQQVPNLWTVVT